MKRLPVLGVVFLLVLALSAIALLLRRAIPEERFTFSYKLATVQQVVEDGQLVDKLNLPMGNENHGCEAIDSLGRPLTVVGWWIDSAGNAHSPFGNVIPNQPAARNRPTLSRESVAAMLQRNEPRMLDCPDGQVTVDFSDTDLGRANHEDTEMRAFGTLDTRDFNFTLIGSANREDEPTPYPNRIVLTGHRPRDPQSLAIPCGTFEAYFGENQQGLKFEQNELSDFCEVVIDRFSRSDDQAQGRFYFTASKNNRAGNDTVLVVIDGRYLVDIAGGP